MNEWSERLVEMNPDLVLLHEAYESAVKTLQNNYGLDYEVADAITGELLLIRRFGKHYNNDRLREIDHLTSAYPEVCTLYDVAEKLEDSRIRLYLD